MSNEQVREALEDLGMTADEVANRLTQMGVTGNVEQAMSCPVANYLKKKFPEAQRACVFIQATVTVGEFDPGYPDDSQGKQYWTHTPRPVFEFIKEFDAGMYPQLKKGSA